MFIGLNLTKSGWQLVNVQHKGLEILIESEPYLMFYLILINSMKILPKPVQDTGTDLRHCTCLGKTRRNQYHASILNADHYLNAHVVHFTLASFTSLKIYHPHSRDTAQK